MGTDRDNRSREHSGLTDDVFDALGHPYRRRILAGLADSESRGREELTATLAAELDEDCTDVAVALTHVHLPKLRESEFVEVDSDAGRVERGPRFGVVGPLVRLVDDADERLPFAWP